MREKKKKNKQINSTQQRTRVTQCIDEKASQVDGRLTADKPSVAKEIINFGVRTVENKL